MRQERDDGENGHRTKKRINLRQETRLRLLVSGAGQTRRSEAFRDGHNSCVWLTWRKVRNTRDERAQPG